MLDVTEPSPVHAEVFAAATLSRPRIGPGVASARRLVGYGKSFASFGEIVQGRRTDGEDFLITLPVDLWSTCRVVCEASAGPSVVDADLCKSRQVAEEMLAVLGMGSGVSMRLELTRNIPIGKGLSSSTADMLAVVRAFQELFGVIVTDAFISRLFTRIEPHDALHYPMSVVYNHRRGRLLDRLDHIPDFQIVAVDAGGRVCTEAYNKRLDFGADLIAEYQRLYQRVLTAFAAKDDAAIAGCAQRSTELHVMRTDNAFLRGLLEQARAPGVLGIVTTHSGTCGGFLLPGNATAEQVAGVEAAVGHFGALFRTRTLRMLR